MRRVVILFSLLALAPPAFADAPSDARALLSQLISIDTSNPPGHEELAVAAVARQLRAAGVAPEIVPFAPGRSSLVARYRGDGSKRPLLLLAHLDVVGAAGQPWTVPPFHLTEKDGWLYGRGVLDDKGFAAVATTVFLELVRTHAKLHRDVILALTGDEESGGAGLREILAHHRALVGDAELGLNEGGSIKLDEQGRVVSVSYQAAEKTYQSFQLTAPGLGGHASVPNDENAIYRLARALDKIHALVFPPRLGPTVREELRAMAAHSPDARAAALRRLADAKGTPPASALAIVDEYPLTRAMVRTTCTATMLSGGTRENALPVLARATLNCRLMPGDRTADVERALIQAIGDPKIAVKRLEDNGAGPEIPVGGPVRDALERVSAQLFGKRALVSASVGLGATDSRFLRQLGIHSYGIGVMPKPEELIRSPHGPDEGAPATSVATGVHFLAALVDALAR
ncbi:MAG TPA: M20/M25/M40 family metallo-hydrolase [Polyangia bacterium]